MVAIACQLKPEMAMLVPEGREEITTEGGLDVAAQERRCATPWRGSRDAGIVTVVFIDADCARSRRRAHRRARVRDPHRAVRARVPRQGRDARKRRRRPELDASASAAASGRAIGMRFNAGHALNYFNVQPVAALPGVRELHIGTRSCRARCSSAARGGARDEGADAQAACTRSVR
jgi:pyridoxine 5-phosphate synthase